MAESTHERIRKLLADIEASYTRALISAWKRDPENFHDYVIRLEEIIDLRRKLSS